MTGNTRGRRGRVYPLRYLLALPLAAGMAGDDELDAAGEWAASAPEEVLLKLGALRDAATIGRILGQVDQCQYDDALCSWAAARARALRPGLRKHLRVDGKAVRGARRGGRAPMLLSGIWDDGTTAAQLPADVKTNEIPVFRELLGKIPDGDLKDAVITADQMHTQREHARLIARKGGHYVFTIGENQPGLFGAADALCWKISRRGGLDRGPRPRPHRRPHHHDHAAHRADHRPVPARQAGVPGGALQLRPRREPPRRRRRTRHHQPGPGPGRPR